MSGYVSAFFPNAFGANTIEGLNDDTSHGLDDNSGIAGELAGIDSGSVDAWEIQEKPPVAMMRFEGYAVERSLFRTIDSAKASNAAKNAAPTRADSLFDDIDSIDDLTFGTIVLKTLGFTLTDPRRLPSVLACVPSVLENESRKTLEVIAGRILPYSCDDPKKELDRLIGKILVNMLFPDRNSQTRRDMLIACTRHEAAFVRACAVAEFVYLVSCADEKTDEDPDGHSHEIDFLVPVLLALVDLMKRETNRDIREMILLGASEEDFKREIEQLLRHPSFARLVKMEARSSIQTMASREFKN